MTVAGKLKALGFKKLQGTAPGFHMFELDPATLRKPRSEERTSAQARKRTSKLDK